MKILQINSSAKSVVSGMGSYSTRLANELVERLVEAHRDATVTVRDLNRTPHPALDEATLQALYTPVDHRTSEQAARVALDDRLIAEVMAADVIVIGAPMYNFAIPSQLKNWIDAIARAGVTFRYGEKGPVGLVRGKSVYVVTSRGGIHRDRPTDQVVPYLRLTLGFLGMTDVRVVYAEGLAMGPDAEARAMADARLQITELASAPEAA
jgi:FMN-dependent NADH-azoreductase